MITSTYTRAQAIEDGVLIDVSAVAREAGIRFPVAISRAAYADCVTWSQGNRACQDEAGRLWDVVYMLYVTIRTGARGSVLPYSLYRVPNRPNATRAICTRLKAICGPGDDMEPVITILLPDED